MTLTNKAIVTRYAAQQRARLKLKEGDHVEVFVAGERAFGIDRDRTRERALARIRQLRKALPPDWKFDRDEANAR